MSDYRATIRWEMAGEDFVRGRFSREHTWEFDGGVKVPASPSPHVVPAPWSNQEAVDPEEAFVASVASCHMLTFLWVASKAKLEVESYEDEAVGVMEKNEKGIPWVSKITLSPKITWKEGAAPTAEQLEELHPRAHEYCFIANSIKTEVVVK